jgi:RNA polymerase sigma-70 factor (ECF subfamily)
MPVYDGHDPDTAEQQPAQEQAAQEQAAQEQAAQDQAAQEQAARQRIEQALLVRARDGDPAAYEDLVRLHQEIAFRTAFTVTRSAADAEDAAQEGFVKAYRALDRFRLGAPFRPWLLRIVANEARNRIRTRTRGQALAERAGLQARTESGGAQLAPTPEEQLLAGERREALNRALEQLPHHDRLVIAYRYFLELSEAETAAAMDCPPGTVKSRLSRALARLRAGLGEELR